MPNRKLKALNNPSVTLISLWDTLITKEVSLLDDERGPLVNLGNVVAYFELPPLPSLSFANQQMDTDLPENGSVTELDETGLILLRQQICYSNLNHNLCEWAEKILRHCEIQRTGLWKQLRRRFDGKLQTELFILQLVAFLIDFYYMKRDIRFLNAGLKVYETRWRGNLQRLFSRLDARGLPLVTALFHVRFLIMSEYAIQQVSMGS